jgi:hypothetical protein
LILGQGHLAVSVARSWPLVGGVSGSVDSETARGSIFLYLRISKFSRHARVSTADHATLCEKPIKIGGTAVRRGYSQLMPASGSTR